MLTLCCSGVARNAFGSEAPLVRARAAQCDLQNKNYPPLGKFVWSSVDLTCLPPFIFGAKSSRQSDGQGALSLEELGAISPELISSVTQGSVEWPMVAVVEARMVETHCQVA